MPAAAAASPAVKVKAGDTIHVVEGGQTLYSIARQYGSRVDDVVALNGLQAGQGIRVGQKLRIPAGGAPVAAVHAIAYAPEKPQMRGAPPKPLGKLIVKNGKAVGAAAPEAVAAVPPAEPAAPAIPVAPVGPAVADVPKVIPAAPAAAPVQTAASRRTRPPASVIGTSFRWPVRGRHLRLRLEAERRAERRHQSRRAGGTPVKAAEAGTSSMPATS